MTTLPVPADAVVPPEPAKHPKKHKARIEHKIPGRIRMKVPAAKTNPLILDAYKDVFMAIPGIDKVKTKPDTGSIIIHYDPKREAEFQHGFHHCCADHMHVTTARAGDEIEEMAEKIEAEAEFFAQRSRLARALVDVVKDTDTQLKQLTDNTLDLKIVLAVGLAAYTFLEIGPEAATPMWVTLALFSMHHFAELHQAGQPAAAPSL